MFRISEDQMNTGTQLQAVLSYISERVRPAQAVWVVGGSVGLLLRGLALGKPPRDLDLYADKEDAAAIHHALIPYSVDDPSESRTSIYRSILSHYVIEGISVELVCGFEVTAFDSHYRTEVREVLYPMGQVAGVPPNTYTIVPLAHELIFNAMRGREDRTRLIAEAILRNSPEHGEALERILRRNHVSETLKERLNFLL
ncbi:hypothetical protein AB6A23_15295 [Paenibacillus tarimensis]